MEYQIKESAISNKDAAILINQRDIAFSTTSKSAQILPNPAELFLGAFASCTLKMSSDFLR